MTYWAISVLSSRTVWLNSVALIIAALSLTEVVNIIPARFMGAYGATLALLNLFLRTITVRPVAFIGMGTATPVEIARIAPPAPPLVSD